MHKPNPVGFHTRLNEEVSAHILANVPGNYVMGQVARMSKIPKETLRRWLRRGEDEAIKGEETIFAQLWVNFEHKRGEEIKSILEDVRKRVTNWQASWELLRSVAREDFGVEAVEYKELFDLYKKLSDDLKRFMEKPVHGAVNNV